jgi:CMP-N,N'-diacetyllegionaminic acid synthase
MQLVAIIPARSGSKGVPGKNTRPLAGKPLIAWTIEAAIASGCFDRVVVSTDSPAIAQVAINYGAEVPFLRPHELATDEASSAAVVQHTLDFLGDVSAFVLLQPTSPFRSLEDIQEFVALFSSSGADRAISVVECGKSPYWAVTIDGGVVKKCFEVPDGIRRQDLPKVYMPNGALYAVRRDAFRQDPVFIDGMTPAYVMPPERSLDIDSEMDFLIAEAILCAGPPPVQ